MAYDDAVAIRAKAQSARTDGKKACNNGGRDCSNYGEDDCYYRGESGARIHCIRYFAGCGCGEVNLHSPPVVDYSVVKDGWICWKNLQLFVCQKFSAKDGLVKFVQACYDLIERLRVDSRVGRGSF
ncbi:hypothetical protein O7543_15525 [Solwaraspora sp. WMMA2080]|uniref:hypothetical protein n=1 Tax=unclassified Solwaraspora TaxID=2627926 RepID=UPI00248D13FB|nr:MULTISPECIES: hypothetical protein [unclassified Solwaraspora]WBB97740.1 hypothetical protein O7553_01815 [Solwaraspora sp. WMMA2059]WBC18369.1 hypothetical protein O7543_15525 [Solwaraspora sp. WMMA2080]